MKPVTSVESASSQKGFGGLFCAENKPGRLHKYWHYVFIIFVLVAFLSLLALVNGYFHFVVLSPYGSSQKVASSTLLLSGYIGMFLSIVFSPVPDYVLVPAFGYLSTFGLFNPYFTFLVCLIGALVPIEYVCGRFAARPLLMKVLSFMRISENKLEATDKWLIEHGKFSIFISTFIPFFYSAASLAAGTLKMNAAEFFLSSTAGFALRFLFLEFVGFYGIYVFTSSFDYSHRTLFLVLLVLSLVYLTLHLVRVLVNKRVNVQCAVNIEATKTKTSTKMRLLPQRLILALWTCFR